MATDLEQRHVAAHFAGLRRWRRGWHWSAFEHADGYGPKRPDLNHPKSQRLLQTGFHCGDSKVSELCVYVAASNFRGCWTCRLFFPSNFWLQDRQDLTLAMVPAEGVAADLSHLNMKCKVSWIPWMGKYGNRAPETSGFKIFKCFALKTMRIRDNTYFGTFREW